MNRDPVAEWCDSIPSLSKIGGRLWAMSSSAAISYPEEAHAALLQIEEKSYWFKHRNNVICSVVDRFRPGEFIVDIGGGNGFVSAGLARHGFPAVVVEPGTAGADAAIGRGLNVVRAPFQDLPVPEASMPAAAMFDVLEHIEDDLAALANVHRGLAANGRLYVSVPAFSALWSDEDIHAGHYRRYSLALLRERLASAGFEVEYATYFFAALVAPVFVFRSIASRVGLRRGHSAGQTQQEHSLPAGAIGQYMAGSFDRELRRIAGGGVVRAGTSCLAVARKIS